MIELIGIFLAIISFVPLSLDAHVLTKRTDPLLTRGGEEDDLRILSFKEYLKESEYKNHETPYYDFNPEDSHKLENDEDLPKNDDDDDDDDDDDSDDEDGNYRWEEKLEQVDTGKKYEKKLGEHIEWEDESLGKKNAKSQMRLFNTAETHPRRSFAEFQRSEKLGSQSKFDSEAGKPRSKRSEDEFSTHSSNSTTREDPAADLSYKNTEEWSINDPACSGRFQSPINIDTEELIGLVVPSNLIWAGYWQRPKSLMILNSGHTVELEATWDGITPFLTGGPLIGEYEFSQLHFHWASQDSIGSEHTINNNRFPMEMHMVHYKRDYGSWENAIQYRDGVVLVAFFFEICETPNLGFNLLMDGLIRLENKPGVNETVQPFRLDLLLAPFERNYVTYRGSLPTPPCFEIATWLISMESLPISKTQMDTFRKISKKWSENGNSRPTQALNGRRIYYVGY